MPANFEADHMGVFDRAFEIYVKRSKVRGQMWMDTSIQREIEMIQEKLNRMKAALAGGIEDEDFKGEFIDNALDLMNFANFAIKKAEMGKVL